MIKGIAHVCLGTDDLKGTEDFYCGVLDLKKLFLFEKNKETFGFYLKAGNDTFIEVFLEKNYCSGIQRISHFCLEVEDIDSFIATVRTKGWEISDKSRASAGNWQCWTTDPNGVRIEFQEYTEECSHKTGKDCQVKW